MTDAKLFPVDEAIEAIRRNGLYFLDDAAVGQHVREFSELGFPTKSPLGVRFLARNSADREDVRDVCRSILTLPEWGLIKIYSDILPPGYVYRFHNGSNNEINTILVQLWSPGAEVAFFHGSGVRTIDRETMDHEISKTWGLLAASERHFDPPICKSFKLGGLALSDSRLGFAIRRGYVIFIGFATADELTHWAKMKLPYTDQMKEEIQSLEERGIKINYSWITHDTKS